MDKLDMQTPNITDRNYETLAKLFPNAVTETIDENGEVVRAIDADVLRQEISCKVVEGKEERYQFTWPDKKNAIKQVNIPITSTLRPLVNESIDFESTKNIYIEGDNIDVLKLLQETYLNKIKMIYIDPPYNTGEDFIYSDDYSLSVEEYKAIGNNYDENGNRLFKNLKHSSFDGIKPSSSISSPRYIRSYSALFCIPKYFFMLLYIEDAAALDNVIGIEWLH